MTPSDMQRLIFAYIFQTSNQLQVILDHGLKDDHLTAKQFFLMIVINTFDGPPTLSMIAERFGSSRQNAKQLVNKLVDKGFVEMSKDQKDQRALRFSLTEKALDYWKKRNDEDTLQMNQLFDNMNKETLQGFMKGFEQLMDNMTTITKCLRHSNSPSPGS